MLDCLWSPPRRSLAQDSSAELRVVVREAGAKLVQRMCDLAGPTPATHRVKGRKAQGQRVQQENRSTMAVCEDLVLARVHL